MIKQYILKVETKLPNDILKLNERIKFIEAEWKGGRTLIVESNWERLVLLARQPSSVFRLPRIYPSIKYYVAPHDPESALRDLQQFLRNFQLEFSDLRIGLTIVVSSPTDLLRIQSLVAWLRLQPETFPIIVFAMEKPPQVMGQELQQWLLSSSSQKPLFSADPLSSLQQLCSLLNATKPVASSSSSSLATGPKSPALQHTPISLDDLFPVSYAECLELLLMFLGYGKLNLHPSPFCGFFAAFSSLAERGLHSHPVSQLVNLQQLYEDLMQLNPLLAKGGGFSQLKNLPKIRSVFRKCQRPDFPLPDIPSFLLQRGEQTELSQFIRGLQFFVFHHNMDLGSVDLVRRCDCPSLRDKGHRFVATCTGCF